MARRNAGRRNAGMGRNAGRRNAGRGRNAGMGRNAGNDGNAGMGRNAGNAGNAGQEVYYTHSVVYENDALIVELEHGLRATVTRNEVDIDRGHRAPALRFKPRGTYRLLLRHHDVILEQFIELPGVPEGSVRISSIAHELIVEWSNAPPAPPALPAPQGLGPYITLRVIGQNGNRSLLLLRGRTRLRNLMDTYCRREAFELDAMRFLYNERELTGDETPDEDGNRSLLLLRGRTRLRNLMNTYCHRQAVELNAIRFLYNGRQLTGDETPDELQMEDGHEINAIMNL